MRFHGLKMREINETIADLWTKTYQGTGALASELPSAHPSDDTRRRHRQDHDQGRLGGQDDRRRSLLQLPCSSRTLHQLQHFALTLAAPQVVMFKDQTEMDMRGRCSAGQKVLASIIIRLALAESFSVNCGIMALDEPTTNLDQDNVKALASSLAE